jgi:hypothetical protein
MSDDEKTEVSEGKSQGWLTTKRRVSIAIGILVIVAIALMVLNQMIKSKVTDTVVVTDVVQSIEITTPGSVTLTDSASDLSISRTSKYVFKKPGVSAKVEDGVLKLQGDCGGVRLGGCSVAYFIAAPANIPVMVNNARAVSLKGVKSDVKVVKSGAVSLNNPYGRVDVQTSGGAVTGTAISSRDVHVTTETGAVNLRFSVVPSNVDVQTQSGAATVQVPKSSTSYKVDASSQSGKTTTAIGRDANSPFAIKVSSESGAVTVEAK